MSLRRFELEIFEESSTQIAPLPRGFDPDAIRLEGYEAGYRSGWDDCAISLDEEGRRLGDDLAQNIRDMSFTYEEARAEVLNAIGPLLTSISEQLLPVLAQAAVKPVVDAELRPLLDHLAGQAVRLTAAPETCRQLEKLAENHADLDIRFHAEPAYGLGRVSLNFAGEGREIDLSKAAEAIAKAISDFCDAPARSETSHSKGVAA